MNYVLRKLRAVRGHPVGRDHAQLPPAPADAGLPGRRRAREARLDGQPVTDAQRAAIEIQLGSPHGSLLCQYVDYLENVVTFRLRRLVLLPDGDRWRTRSWPALPWTLLLVGITTIVAFVVGTLLGRVRRLAPRPRPTASTVTVGATFFAAFPPFWFGLLLLYVFAYKLNAFPLKGGYTAGLTPEWSLSVPGGRDLAQRPARR